MKRYQEKDVIKSLHLKEKYKNRLSDLAITYGYHVNEITTMFNLSDHNINTLKTALKFIKKYNMEWKAFNFDLLNKQ